MTLRRDSQCEPGVPRFQSVAHATTSTGEGCAGVERAPCDAVTAGSEAPPRAGQPCARRRTLLPGRRAQPTASSKARRDDDARQLSRHHHVLTRSVNWARMPDDLPATVPVITVVVGVPMRLRQRQRRTLGTSSCSSGNVGTL